MGNHKGVNKISLNKIYSHRSSRTAALDDLLFLAARQTTMAQSRCVPVSGIEWIVTCYQVTPTNIIELWFDFPAFRLHERTSRVESATFGRICR